MIVLAGIGLVAVIMATHQPTVPLAMLVGFIAGISVAVQICFAVGKEPSR